VSVQPEAPSCPPVGLVDFVGTFNILYSVDTETINLVNIYILYVRR
jgi:hypothetical protein